MEWYLVDWGLQHYMHACVRVLFMVIISGFAFVTWSATGVIEFFSPPFEKVDMDCVIARQVAWFAMYTIPGETKRMSRKWLPTQNHGEFQGRHVASRRWHGFACFD